MLPECEIVDCHHHIGIKVGLDATWEYSAHDLIARMDRFGVRQAVVKYFVSALRIQEDFTIANRYVGEAVARYPDRLAGAVVINPLFGKEALEEIETYHRIGFKAIKLHPLFHGYYHINSGVVDDVAGFAGDIGLPVFIHSDFQSPICSPYEIARFARRFPGTQFVMLHMGLYPPMVKFVPGIVKDLDNVFLDTSETPDAPNEVLVSAVRVLGASRLMLGSDGPEYHIGMYLRKIELAIAEYGLAYEDAVQILGGNARRLFRLEEGVKK